MRPVEMQYAITKSNLPFITPRPNLPVLKANGEKKKNFKNGFGEEMHERITEVT